MWNYRTSLLLALFLMTAQHAHSASAGEVVLITNNEAPVVKLNKSQARLIFSKDVKIWGDGSVINVVVTKQGGELFSRFAQEVLNLYPYQIERSLERKRYAGSTIQEFVVNSQEEMLKLVAQMPGAIGYVDKAAVDLKSVKVVRVTDE